jgi:16S rRNA (cytosine967-C5)-methyltransferase
MISPARKLAYRLLFRIESQRLFSDDAVNSPDMGAIDPRDRRLVTEIVYGTLRWQETLDHVLSKLSSRPWQDVTPGARILLRMSFYQLWRMNRIPDHALVNDAVELAKRELGKGVDKYLNGILRHLTRNRLWNDSSFLEDAPDWVQVSLPKWLWDRWCHRYGRDRAKEFAFSLNLQPQAAFRLIGNSNESENVPSGAIRSDIVPNAYIQRNPSGDETEENAPQNEPVQFQDEASQLIPYLLGPIPSNFRIWDACAAPGGKTASLIKITGKTEQIFSSDLRFERAERMVRLLKKAGLDYLNILVADAKIPSPFQNCFDVVLADVPCSGLGTLRRNPEIKWHFKPEEFDSLQQTQKRILHHIADAVRPGGCLLYSTCSTEPEENEQVIASFLESNPKFRIISPRYPEGIDRWVGEDLMVRTFPEIRLWDGFFSALLMRQ